MATAEDPDRRVLFLVGPALGHVGRSLTVADALCAHDGVEVSFACVEPGHGSELLEDRYPFTVVPYEDRLEIGIADRIEECLRAAQADLICLDIAPLWLRGVRFPDVATAYLTNYFLTRSFGKETLQDSQFSELGHECNALRAARGLPAVGTIRELYDRDLVLLCDPPGLVMPGHGLDANQRVVGPCVWNSPVPLPEDVSELSSMVLVSMGSTGTEPIPAVFVDAVAELLGTDAVVWVGRAEPAGVPSPRSNHIHHPTAPTQQLLGRAALAITQGGAGSTYQALCHGVPVAVWPGHANHEVLGEIVQQAGCGILLGRQPLDDLGVIRDGIGQMRSASEQLAETIDELDGPQRAADALVALLGHGSEADPQDGERRVLRLAPAESVLARIGDRALPAITRPKLASIEPMTIVCVRLSGCYDHNLALSDALADPVNELIKIAGVDDFSTRTPAAAIAAAIERAEHDLVAIIAEDVLLAPDWQPRVQEAIGALEGFDPNWALAGCLGWDAAGLLIGHRYDRDGVVDSFSATRFQEAAVIDDGVAILRRSQSLRPDPLLPGSHNLGNDLARTAAEAGRRTYVINAPIIRNLADDDGSRVTGPTPQSRFEVPQATAKIAFRSCSDEYIRTAKWQMDSEPLGPAASGLDDPRLDAPVLLLGRGGSGTRLLTMLAQDVGIFAGNEINQSGDSLEMARSIYRGLFRKYRCPALWQQDETVPDLRRTAAFMLDAAAWPELWGFKLPESVLLLPELLKAFPRAKVVFWSRDPIKTSFGRPHLTAQLDNEIGRTVLPVAYDLIGRSRSLIETDPDPIRMAATTYHQLTAVRDLRNQLDSQRWCTVSFEDVLAGSQDTIDGLAAYVGSSQVSRTCFDSVDSGRATRRATTSGAEFTRVAELLGDLTEEIGYEPVLADRGRLLDAIGTVVAIVGCQRSGTTVTAQLLGAPPTAFMIDEDDGLYDWFDAATEARIYRRFEEGIVLAADQKYNRSRLVRSTSEATVTNLVDTLVLKAPNLTHRPGDLAALKAEAKVLYLVRDPRAVVASMARLAQIDFAGAQRRLLGQQDDLADCFAAELDLLGSDSPAHVKHAAIWVIKTQLQDRFVEAGLDPITIWYEDLVSDPEQTLRLALLRAGMRFEAEMAHHEAHYVGSGPGGTQRGRSVDKTSVETWRDVLSVGELADIREVAGPLAATLGYELAEQSFS